MITMCSGPSRWVRATATGYCRSGVLVAVAGLIPALTVAVAVFGLSFSRSWSAHLHAPQLVRLVAAIGEWALAALWAAAGFSVAMAVLGRPTAQFLRRHGGRWLGGRDPFALPAAPADHQDVHWLLVERSRLSRDRTTGENRSLVHGPQPSFRIRSADGDPQLRRDVVWQA